MVIQPGSSVTGISRVAGIPLALLLAVPVIFRRSHPVGAFAAAVVIGGIQVLLNVRPNATDLVIVILLYTLAAYTPRRISVTGLAICLVGSAVAVARWMPGQLSVLDAIAVGSIMFAVFASLPPETDMVTVELAGAFLPTSKVTVIAENPMLIGNDSERVQLTVARVQVQPGPLMAVGSPAC